MSPARRRIWDGTQWLPSAGGGASTVAELKTARNQLTPGTFNGGVWTPGDYVPGNAYTENSVGAYEGTVFTEVESNTTETGAGMPNRISLPAGNYENTRFWGEILLSGTGTWRFTNCVFAGMRPDVIENMGRGLDGATPAQRGVLRNYNTSRFVEFTDCTLDGKLWYDVRGISAEVYAKRLWNINPRLGGDAQDQPGTVESWQSASSIGISGGNITMRRCEVTNFQDLLVLIGDNWNVTDSWIHKCWWGCRGVGGSSDYYTHADPVQTHNGKNWRFVNNFIGGLLNTDGFNWDIPGNIGYNAGDGGDTSGGMLIQQETTSDPQSSQWITGVTVVGNVMAGGRANANIHYARGNALTDMIFTDNLFLKRPTSAPRNDNGAQIFISDEIRNGGATVVRNYEVEWEQLFGAWPNGGNGNTNIYSRNTT